MSPTFFWLVIQSGRNNYPHTLIVTNGCEKTQTNQSQNFSRAGILKSDKIPSTYEILGKREFQIVNEGNENRNGYWAGTKLGRLIDYRCFKNSVSAA